MLAINCDCFILKGVRGIKNMKNENKEGLVYRAVEIVLVPLAVAVRLQVALIRQTLYAAFVTDRIIAKSKFPRIRFK